MKTCTEVLSLNAPVRTDKVRGFQPPWRTVFVYRCPACGTERGVFASAFRGKTPVPGVGGFQCGAMLTTP